MAGASVAFPVSWGIDEAHALIDRPPVVVGGLAVLARLSNPHRATVDLDVVDRLRGHLPQLELLRAATGAEPVDPTAVLLPTRFGPVTIDVLEVRQVELDRPSDDPGDRLHASAHAWAHDTATELTIEVLLTDHSRVAVTTLVAEPGPLIAMKLQAVINRSHDKQGTDLLDIVRPLLDPATRPKRYVAPLVLRPERAQFGYRTEDFRAGTGTNPEPPVYKTSSKPQAQGSELVKRDFH